MAVEPSVMKIVSLLQQLITSYNQRNSGEVSCEIGQKIGNAFQIFFLLTIYLGRSRVNFFY